MTAYEYSDESSRVDRELVHRWLSTQAYWALGRDRSVQERAFAGSRNFGAYRVADGTQVAYARVVTDGATFGWLCDVFVDPAVRGDGVGTGLVTYLVDALEPLGLGRLLLATADAHGLYAKVGFAPPTDPERWMVRRRDRP